MSRVHGFTAGEGVCAQRLAGCVRRAALAAVPLLLAVPAGADFRLSDPPSPIYYSLAAAAGDEVFLDKTVQVTGDLHANKKVVVGESSLVQGDVSAAEAIDNKGTITGAVNPQASVRALPLLLSESQALAIADRVFDGETVFSNTTVDDVVLVRGKVRLEGAVNGVGTIIATNDIEVGTVASGTGPSLLQPSTRLSLIAFQHVKILENRSLRGALQAGSEVLLEKNVRFEGVLVGRVKVTVKEGSVVAFLNPDLEAPVISGASPADGSFVASARPQIAASFGDDVSGIAAGSVQFLVDDLDRTGEAQIGPGGLTFVPGQDLADGAHTVRISLLDHSGKAASFSWSFGVDTLPPALAITSPFGRIVARVPPQISLVYADGGSGIDPATLVITLDGAAAGASCSLVPDGAACTLPSLATGDHRLTAQIRDGAGNTGTALRDFSFVLDLLPPTVSITTPEPNALLNRSVVRVEGTATDESAISLTINGQPAGVSAGQFSAAVNLAQGSNQVEVLALDEAGRQGSAAVTVTVDSLAPVVAVETPKTGQKVNHELVLVTGTATDTNGVARVEVGGGQAALSGERFETEVALQEGSNTLLVRAFDAAGNVGEAAVLVERFTLPQVVIESPADLSYVASATVDVLGTLSDPAAAVKVNGIVAVVSGNSFVAQNVPLIEGGNILTASATNTALGRTGTDSINVVRDLTAPRVSVYQPREGAEVFEPAVTVSGLVNDIVAGTVNATDVTVTVNGQSASVANRSFMAEGVPLTPGENVLSVVAIDESGNVGQAEVRVRLEPANVPRIVVVSGDDQIGVIGTQLAQPLAVALLDAAGQPVVGKPVLFKVVNSDGFLDGGERQVAVTTGPDGRASVHFSLGNRAGVANQTVEATVSRFRGPAVFRATALASNPSMIVVDAGGQQLGVGGHALPRPLVATVTDAGFNRLGGVPVTFRVVRGRGQFQNSQQQTTVATDTDGRAIVSFILPPEEEDVSHVVEAVIADLEGSPVARFVSHALTAGEVSQTSISGIVVDNSNVPVPGVTLRILDTAITAQADLEGVFQIQPAPVGTVKLLVDGSTATRPGNWPDLEFVITTIAGRDNDLGMPIFLLPLDLQNGVVVDETRGGTLELPEVPGFALGIQPGSVSFPNGTRSGVVSVTAVHSDKVPMVPNFGQQPRLIVTIQPAGARFDPPARLTLPNLEGLAPGTVTEFYSFDHDLGHFVSIGPGTVSEDGTVIVSNPGVGILKAGWHCGGNPAAAGTPADCPPCQICNGSTCVPGCSAGGSSTAGGDSGLAAIFAAQCTCDDGNDCTINDRCDGSGGCKGDPVEVRAINGACVAAVNQALNLTADSNAPDRVKWRAPSGNPTSGMGGSFSVTYSTEGSFVVTAMCGGNSKTKNVSTGPSCASITPMLKEPEVPRAPAPGNFGTVFHGTSRSAKYKGCVDGTKWCFRLEEYVEEHGFGVAHPNIDITGPNDPNVTPTTCRAIIADLTPTGPTTPPPVTAFWSKAAVTAHERFHVTDFSNRVTQRIFNDLRAFVAQAGRCTNCKSATPTAVFEAEKDRLWNVHRPNYFDGFSEPRAHAVSNVIFSALVQQIRQRARNAPAAENWPAACK